MAARGRPGSPVCPLPVVARVFFRVPGGVCYDDRWDCGLLGRDAAFFYAAAVGVGDGDYCDWHDAEYVFFFCPLFFLSSLLCSFFLGGGGDISANSILNSLRSVHLWLLLPCDRYLCRDGGQLHHLVRCGLSDRRCTHLFVALLLRGVCPVFQIPAVHPRCHDLHHHPGLLFLISAPQIIYVCEA